MFTRINISVLFLLLFHTGQAQLKRFSFTESKMGAPFTIIMYTNDSNTAQLLAAQCYRLVDSFVLIYSDYTDSSELSKLSAKGFQNAKPIPLSPALFDIIQKSAFAYKKSNGAFDITIGPLSRLWRKCRKSNQFPDAEMVRQKMQLIGFNRLILDTLNKTITLTKPGIQLDLGGIAQGYIAQKVLDFLTTNHIYHALVNASGDIVMSDAPPEMKGWTVGINVPEETDLLLPNTLLLTNKAITTSGDVYQYLDHEGKRYSHIIDPRTGYGTTFQRNVTAIANDGTTADWLATACSILSIRKSKKLANQLGADLLISRIKNGKPVLYTTKGFATRLKE